MVRITERPDMTLAVNRGRFKQEIKQGSVSDIIWDIGVQWGQGNPNPRVNRSSGKPGFTEFATGMVDPRVGISRFHCTPMIDSISHISNKNLFILYIWRDTVVYLWRRTVKYVTLEVTSDVLKLF